MLSRVANSLYWLSRYLERAENLARLVEVYRYDSLDSATRRPSGGTADEIWRPLLTATSMDSAYAKSEEKEVGMFMTFAESNPDSIRQCIAQARENARMVRDQISEELWRELNRFHLFIRSDDAVQLWQTQPESFHRRTIEFCMLLSGLINATILHDEGWHFIQAGKFLERADKTTRVLDMLAYLGETKRNKLASALKSCSAFSAFQHEFRGAITLDNAMSFLLFSATFPRSVRFCMRQLDGALARHFRHQHRQLFQRSRTPQRQRTRTAQLLKHTQCAASRLPSLSR